MIFNMLVIADLHWGAMDAKIQSSQYEFIFDIIREMRDRIDMLVIAGDYWDSRMFLNSASTINGINWMHKLIDTCKENGVSKFRIIRGTLEHDNDQLETFRYLEEDDEFFRIFVTNTVEEIDGIRIMYCPDENMTHEVYIEKYVDNFIKFPDIGIFHGNLDDVMPSIAVESAKKSNTLVFENRFYHELISGPMIAGHWHIGQRIERWIYVGTPDCWKFGEDDEKGVMFISYDPDNKSFFYRKILNPNSIIYYEYVLDTSFYSGIDDVRSVISFIQDKKKYYEKNDRKYRIAVIIEIRDDKSENEQIISCMKAYADSTKFVKIVTKNKMQLKRKKEEQKRTNELNEKYSFVKDDKLSRSEKIRRCIKSKYPDDDITEQEIFSIIKKYLPDSGIADE